MANSRLIEKSQGFAYVWILALVAILFGVLAVVVEVDTTMQRREKEEQLLAIGREFRDALKRYYESISPTGSHDYPELLNDLVADPRSGQIRRHLRKIYYDPLTGKNEWGIKFEAGRIVGVYSLATGRPLKTDGFSPEEGSLVGATTYRNWVFGINLNLNHMNSR